MRFYKINLISFFKTKFCLFTYISVNILLIIYSIKLLNIDKTVVTILEQEQNLIKFSSIIFIMFLFLSFFYFSKANDNSLIESISVSSKGKNSFYFTQFMVMSTLSFIVFIISFILSVIISLKFEVKESEYLFYCFKLSFYYFFLADIIAIIIGMACSQIKKRTLAYITMILLSVFFSPISNKIPNIIFMATEKVNLFSVFSFFEIYPLNFSTINHAYGVEANFHSIFRILLWISLLSLIILLISSFRVKIKKIVSLITCLCVFIISLTVFIEPYSEAAHNLDPQKGFCSETWYYLTTSPKDAPMQYNEECDFNITSYEMNFHIDKKLKAVSHIKIDRNNLKEYKFTLYHGYNIINISDSKGNSLKYDRIGDYIKVYPVSDTNMISFTYEGFSPLFYSNSQGIYLPAGFAYYPINGYHYIYDIGKQGRIATKLKYSIPIKINIESKSEIFCNLNKTDNNSFEGVSDGVTLVGGFYKETTVDSTRLIYKYLDTIETPTQNIDNTLKEYLYKFPQYKGKTIIISPENHSMAEDERKFEISDHIVASSLSSAFYNGVQDDNIIYNHLDLFYTFLNYYNKDSELYKLTQNDFNELVPNDNNLNVVLAKKINQYGPDDTYTKILNIQMDFENDDNTLELAKSIDSY